MLTALPRYTRRPARELVCPDCGDALRLKFGALHCCSLTCLFVSVGTALTVGLDQLATGPRLTPDCHLTALACFHRRTRECVRWEVETGRRMVGKGRAS